MSEKNLLETALIKFDYKEPTNEELAQHIGFTNKELKMMKIFWEPCFNKSWLYLPREMIKNWFCKEDKGRDAIRHFYDRILFKYDKGVDYKVITKNDPLILNNFYSPKVANGNRAKFYAVTGECFKMICMERNKDIRRYYIKIEELAILFLTNQKKI